MFEIISADRPWTQYRFAPELIAWRDAVIGHGGARPSMQEMVRRNRLIHADMQSGAWALTDDILMSGEDVVQSLVSLKRRMLCIRYNSPIFDARSGYILDGYASYIEWPFVPSTHAVAMTATSKRLAVWNLANIRQSNSVIGSQTAMTNKMLLRPRTTEDEIVIGLNTQPSPRVPLPEPFDSRGFTVGSTSSATSIRVFKDGARLTEATGLTVVPGLSTYSFYLGTTNIAGVPGEFCPCAIPYAALGAQLSDAQELAVYQGVRQAMVGMVLTGEGTGEEDE